ncbi:MAG TPA: SH3 domain-containing protein [Candidatus Polarisedimenticolia bacterium]|nr:SH3 domain-containing protein [Candidatus Polarisedimenticolia bacterium]
MRLTYILPVALLGLVSAAPLASADMLSVPSPKLQSATQPNGIEMVADKQMQTAANDVHLRSKPTTSSTRLATLKIGTSVDVLKMVDNNTWAKVKYGTKTGYIRADLLK